MTSRPGMLDAQLSLTGAFIDLPQPVATIVKRDGRSDAFDAHKIANSIERAGIESQEIDRNTACSLASAVALYIADETNARTSVDAGHVYDAVTRVLREMGYDRTARCYLRFREVHLHDSSNADAAGAGQSIDEWDWDRTASELAQTGSLASETIGSLVSETERRLRAAGFAMLTVPLVRESLSAVARERGIENLERTLGTLEISRTQVARILTAPSEGLPHGSADPEGSSRVLAARVKQAYALASVYSTTVSEAHVRGDLYVHDLGAPDRLCSLTQPLERLKRFGMETAVGGHTSSPAREPDILIAQIAGQTSALRPYFSAEVTWDALNFSFAPYIHQLDEASMRDLAKVLLYELAYRKLADGAAAPSPILSLHWDVPAHLHGVELAGPGGAYTERTCDDYLVQARGFARAILAEYAEIVGHAHPIPVPALDIHLTPIALKSAEGLAFLERAIAADQRSGQITFRCDSDSSLLPHAGDPLSPVRIVASRVTLNLPRAAYRSRDESGLLAELDRMLQLAIRAHTQKRAFLKELIGKHRTGPLGLLDTRQEGRPMVDLDRATFAIGLTGLNECVGAMTRRELHETPEAVRLAETVLAHLRQRCDEWSEDYGIDLSLEPSRKNALGKHFAASDIDIFGEVARQFTSNLKDGPESSYTLGLGAANAAALRPMERIRLESRLHPYLHNDAVCTLSRSAFENDSAAALNSIEKAFRETSCRGIILY